MVHSIIYFTLLLISIGASAGAILLVNYLRKSFPVPFIESYFYYVIMISVFGIYAVWSVAFIGIMLDEIAVSNEIVDLFSQVIPYFGFPFLIMSWYMFIKFSYDLTGTKITRIVSVIYFMLNLIFFIILGWFILEWSGDGDFYMVGMIYIFMLLDLIIRIWGLTVMYARSKKTSSLGKKKIHTYVTIEILFILLKSGAVISSYFYPASMPVFILAFFLSIVVPVLHIYYNILPLISADSIMEISTSFENLVARYGVTKREREIIEQVCAGKSNQEIADTLFISLQTVKDHTHRIYLKMDIKSRVQLIRLFQSTISD